MYLQSFRNAMLIVFFTLFASNYSFAQDVNCCDSCTNPWQNITLNVPLPNMGGVIAQVICQKRLCNGTWELNILRVNGLYPPASTYNPDEIFEELMRQIILTNPMMFPSYLGGPGNVWRFCTKSCWGFLDGHSGSSVLIPCSSSCCQTEIFVHLSQDCYTRSYEITRQYTDNIVDCPPAMTGCYNVCYPYIDPKDVK